jgi:hypothetical protein
VVVRWPQTANLVPYIIHPRRKNECDRPGAQNGQPMAVDGNLAPIQAPTIQGPCVVPAHTLLCTAISQEGQFGGCGGCLTGYALVTRLIAKLCVSPYLP